MLLDDYFSTVYPNVRKAVSDYEYEHDVSLIKCPIGDGAGLAIIKPYE